MGSRLDFRVGPPKSNIHILFCLLDLLHCAVYRKLGEFWSQVIHTTQ